MLENTLFFVVILASNVIQGVTGFAGTILAMPFSLQLVGYNVAVPILNALGLLSGIYVFVQSRKLVQWKELGKILIVMSPALFLGILLKNYMARYDKAIYIILGILVLLIAITGLGKMILERKNAKKDKLDAEIIDAANDSNNVKNAVLMFSLLVASGLVHGMFVCGGPLLISYLTKKIKDRGAFRATISTVWIFLNGLILITHATTGLWQAETIKTGLISVPFLLLGMFFGGILYKRMSQKAFMILTYILLLISGLSLLVK